MSVILHDKQDLRIPVLCGSTCVPFKQEALELI